MSGSVNKGTLADNIGTFSTPPNTAHQFAVIMYHATTKPHLGVIDPERAYLCARAIMKELGIDTQESVPTVANKGKGGTS